MAHYIKFKIPEDIKASPKTGSLLKLFVGFLKIIIPQANPDYDKKIQYVKFWLIEFDNENSYPVREVGLDENHQSIVKMPYKKNYGYWTDNELKIEDFKKSFNTEEIDRDYFIKKWNQIT